MNIPARSGSVRPSQRPQAMACGAREIILVRHGSAGAQTMGSMQLSNLTLHDPPLLEMGLRQAEHVSRFLTTISRKKIFSSPLQRARQTAMPLATSCAASVEIIDDLHEIYMGDFEMEFDERLSTGDPLCLRVLAEERWELVPNAEPASVFDLRIKRAICSIVEQLPEGTVGVAFAHAGLIAEVCRQATGSRPFAFLPPDNGSLTRIVAGGSGGWRLRSFNDTAHLVAPLQ